MTPVQLGFKVIYNDEFVPYEIYQPLPAGAEIVLMRLHKGRSWLGLSESANLHSGRLCLLAMIVFENELGELRLSAQGDNLSLGGEWPVGIYMNNEGVMDYENVQIINGIFNHHNVIAEFIAKQIPQLRDFVDMYQVRPFLKRISQGREITLENVKAGDLNADHVYIVRVDLGAERNVMVKCDLDNIPPEGGFIFNYLYSEHEGMLRSGIVIQDLSRVKKVVFS